MALTIVAPDSVEVVRKAVIEGVAIEDAEGHVDVKVHCQFGTLSLSLEKMPTGCHIDGNNSSTVTTGGQSKDVNNLLTTLTYYYPDCYTPDSITFQVTQPQTTAQAEVTQAEIKVEAPAR